ncbi:MAG: glycosyltransferase [Patescibacteria group bacterium]
MRIAVDISQIVHEGTGVAHYVRRMVEELLKRDKDNEYILFGASLRKRHVFAQYFKAIRYLNRQVKLVVIPMPPTLLDVFWNRLHIIPIEWFIGRVDVFWSSDWTQPPLQHARGITTIHDLTVLRYPESFAGGLRNIVIVQKRRLKQARLECQAFLVDSEATKKDAMELLGIDPKRLVVVYPGYP